MHAGDVARSSPVTAVTTPTPGMATASLFNSPARGVSPVPGHTSTAAWDAAANGGDGVAAAAAAGAGGKKVKKLLPTQLTRDPEVQLC